MKATSLYELGGCAVLYYPAICEAEMFYFHICMRYSGWQRGALELFRSPVDLFGIYSSFAHSFFLEQVKPYHAPDGFQPISSSLKSPCLIFEG